VDLRGKKILVTGGTGFIGSALVRGLLFCGAEVRCLDNDSRGSRRRLSELSRGIEFVRADIRDRGAVSAATSGVDCVCHLAYVNGTEYFYSQPELILEIAVKGMTNVLDACVEHGVRDLCLASSSEVYQTPPQVPTDETAPLSIPDVGNPRYSYGGGKIISELLAINYGRKHFDRVTIFRPHNVYGPDMGNEHVIPQLVLKLLRLAESTESTVQLPIQGSGRETRAFVFIDDLVEGVLKVLQNGSHLGIYHIGTDHEVSIAELVDELGNAIGRSVVVRPGELRPGGTLRRCPDITKMRALGYVPKVTLRDGLKKTVAWYSKNR
jgi:nucleoside-diphosphate-sugar epimerase